MRRAHWSVLNVDRRLGRLTTSITARSKLKKNALYGVYLNSTSLERPGNADKLALAWLHLIYYVPEHLETPKPKTDNTLYKSQDSIHNIF